MRNRWLVWVLGLWSTVLQGQELYVERLHFADTGGARAHGLALNPQGHALVLGDIGPGWPLAASVSPGGVPEWVLVTDGMGALERALPVGDGWVVAGAVDFWPSDYGGAFVARLDGTGGLLWQVGVTDARSPVRLALAPEGGYFLSFNAGFRIPGAGPGVVRVGASGEPLWLRVLAERLWHVNDLCSAPDGSLLVVGTASPDGQQSGFASLWDAQGQVRWSFRLPQGTRLDACSFGPPGVWLLVGGLDNPASLPELWLATVDREGRVSAQKTVASGQGLRGYSAAAGWGWMVAAASGQPSGEAVILELPWDLSRMTAWAYHGGGLVVPAGVAPLADGSTVLAGTDTTVSSGVFLVKSRGRLQDFWECVDLSQGRVQATDAQLHPEAFSLAFSPEAPYEASWVVTPRWGDVPDRELRCVGIDTPVPDLVLEGHASFDEELGVHSLVIGLRVTNQGEAPAPATAIEVVAGHRGIVRSFPAGFSCQKSPDQHRVVCDLGVLPAGAGASLSFAVSGSLLDLRQGSASARTAVPEKSYRNNRLAFDSIMPLVPRRVWRPKTGATVRP